MCHLRIYEAPELYYYFDTLNIINEHKVIALMTRIRKCIIGIGSTYFALVKRDCLNYFDQWPFIYLFADVCCVVHSAQCTPEINFQLLSSKKGRNWQRVLLLSQSEKHGYSLLMSGQKLNILLMHTQKSDQQQCV